jgi:hypothetical protein
MSSPRKSALPKRKCEATEICNHKFMFALLGRKVLCYNPMPDTVPACCILI